MESAKLTRDEIALQFLCAAISASSDNQQLSWVNYLPDVGTSKMDTTQTTKFVEKAFKLADLFIAVRDAKN